MKTLGYDDSFIISGRGRIVTTTREHMPELGECILIDDIPHIVTGLEMFSKLLECMEYVHTEGVLHRDIKAGNILGGGNYKNIFYSGQHQN